MRPEHLPWQVAAWHRRHRSSPPPPQIEATGDVGVKRARFRRGCLRLVLIFIGAGPLTMTSARRETPPWQRHRLAQSVVTKPRAPCPQRGGKRHPSSGVPPPTRRSAQLRRRSPPAGAKDLSAMSETDSDVTHLVEVIHWQGRRPPQAPGWPLAVRRPAMDRAAVRLLAAVETGWPPAPPPFRTR